MARTPLSLLAALALTFGTCLWSAEDAPAPTTAPAAAVAAEVATTVAATTATAEAPAAAEAAPAAPAPTLDTGNTAWMLVATVLVLMMTIPGLALFYGGLVRSKNMLSVLMQCFAVTCTGAIIWLAVGYSMAFSVTGMVQNEVNINSIVGALDKSFLAGLTKESLWINGVPESVFFVFQMTFAIITPLLIVGAFAERMKFSTMLVFSAIWSVLVYAPMCHMVWAGNGGLIWDMGALDFAGGTVVHINAGIAGLVAALIIGKRQGYPNRPMKPHNLVFSVIGASLLWCGWFGFNAGSAVGANYDAGMAMLVTMLATAGAGFTWMVAEWVIHGKPSVLGIISGAVAGLVAITPACGYSGPIGSLILGCVSGFVCFLSVAYLKKALGYDDSLDAFGVHGIGGIIGAIGTGIVASTSVGGFKDLGEVGISGQVWIQIKSVLFTLVFSGVLTAIILYILKATMGLRVAETDEEEGLDITQHGEEAYAQST
jgi:Amt family ammonium transporter